MNLLFNRKQKWSAAFSLIPLRFGSGVIFHLHAEIELDEAETKLVERYRLAGSPIVMSNTLEDLKKAFSPALVIGLLTFLGIWLLGTFDAGATLGFGATLVMTIVYFRTLREEILVSDLLDGGRTFPCDSIVSLIQKEALIEGVSQYLRQVLESAKTWDDRETIAIKPLDKDAAKRAVLTALHG